MRLIIAILIGKLIAFLTRSLKIGGGSAAPGLFALKIEPQLVEKLAGKIPRNIIITGTNGKTTTSRMIAYLSKQSGLKVIRNHTGSNLERGIASALIQTTNLVDLGIWELDEAAFNSAAPKLKPDIVVFLNVFRDQLDRYGEVDTVVKRWCETLGKLSRDTVILVNGDDQNTLKLKNHFKGKKATFGVEGFKIQGESVEKSRTNKKLTFLAKKVKLDGLNGSSFQLTINHKLSHTPPSEVTMNLPLPGVYHIYDAIAAIATISHLLTDVPTHRYIDILANFQPAFGRFEKLPFGYIFLIKNPAGATQVFETLAPNLTPNSRLLIALNDNLADGTDISWIWDSKFEKLLASSLRAKRGNLYVSGTRANDLAVRLKYAGFDPKSIIVEPSLKMALQQARADLKGSLYILPTYTALLEFQRILAKIGVKKEYWKNE